jgi:hypothetical protein
MKVDGRIYVHADTVRTGNYRTCIHCGGRLRPSAFLKRRSDKTCKLCTKLERANDGSE